MAGTLNMMPSVAAGDGAGIQRILAHVLPVVDARHDEIGRIGSSMPVNAMCTESVGVPFT